MPSSTAYQHTASASNRPARGVLPCPAVLRSGHEPPERRPLIELVGTSGGSWEKAAAAAVERAAEHLRDLYCAEVMEQDLQIQDGKVFAYRKNVNLSFRYEVGD